MRKFTVFTDNILYRASRFIFVKMLLRHDMRWGGQHQEKIKGVTFVPINKEGYFLKYLLYRGKDSKTHYGTEALTEHTSTDDCSIC